MLGFAEQVAAFTRKAEGLTTDLWHDTLRQLVEEMTTPKGAGGHLPVVTGNLRNSVAVSARFRIEIDWKTKKFRNPADAVNNAIAGVELGETAWVGFRAPYARKVETEHGFLRLAQQRWPQIVDEVVRAKLSRL